MTTRSVTHASFSLERTFDAPAERVFAAFADPAAKAAWFNGPEEWGPDEQTMDFRVGGRETSVGGPPGGPVHAMALTYHDIIPDERIVWTYDMELDGNRISVSVATVELHPDGVRTHLVFTEQGAFLDGYDTAAERKHGTGELLDALGRFLTRTTA